MSSALLQLSSSHGDLIFYLYFLIGKTNILFLILKAASEGSPTKLLQSATTSDYELILKTPPRPATVPPTSPHQNYVSYR